MEKEDKIIVLRQFEDAIEANIAKTKLDAYGIPCFLTEENMAGLYPGQGLLAIKVRLHAFAGDRERAIQILADNGFLIDLDAGTCPNCKSTRLTRAFPKKNADSLAYVLFGVFMPHKKVSLCLDCGCEF